MKHLSKNIASKPRRKPVAKEKATEKMSAADPRKVRTRAVNKVLNEADAMVDGVIQEVLKGSHVGLKTLFEFAGIFEPPPLPNAEDEESLAAMLLRSLREEPPGVAPAASGQVPGANTESVNLND